MEPTLEQRFSEIERETLAAARAKRHTNIFKKGTVRTNTILKKLGTNRRTVKYSELTNAEVYTLAEAINEPNFTKQRVADLTYSFINTVLSYRTPLTKSVFIQGESFLDTFDELDSYLRDLSADIANIYIERAKREAYLSIDDEPVKEEAEDEVKKARFRNPIRRIKP
jgi:hypothetical protein